MSKKDENRKTKPVYFSKLEQFDLELLEHAEKLDPVTGKKRNFSKYVRRLIEEDMKRKKNQNKPSPSGYIIEENLPILDKNESYAIETKKAMSSFL